MSDQPEFPIDRAADRVADAIEKLCYCIHANNFQAAREAKLQLALDLIEAIQEHATNKGPIK